MTRDDMARACEDVAVGAVVEDVNEHFLHCRSKVLRLKLALEGIRSIYNKKTSRDEGVRVGISLALAQMEHCGLLPVPLLPTHPVTTGGDQ